LAVKKTPTKKCGDCTHIDRESYRGVRLAVCYLIKKIDGEPVAMTVTDKTAACGYYRGATINK
jgi:hypothetical protein